MAGGKLPPRQKMIGLMYLVLLALLAMNVSKSILESFIIINDGIEVTTKTFDAKNDFMYTAFDKAASESPAAKVYADKAQKVRKEANAVYEHIVSLKKKLYEQVDGIPPEVADTIPLSGISSKDNYDKPTYVMGLAEPANPTKVAGLEEFSAVTLEEKLNAYRDMLLGVFEDKDVKAEMEGKIAYLETGEIEAHDGAKPWTVGMFYHNPLAAVVTTLSKLQSDVRTAEAEVVAKLYENIDAGGVSFNEVYGLAYAPKAYVLEGDSFKAEVFMAAFDNRVDPEVYIGKYDSAAAASVNKTGKFDVNTVMQGTKGEKWGEGDWFQLQEVANGKGNLRVKESVGVHEWGGIIKLNTKKGPKVYPFNSSFEVGRPSTTIAATKMNVFYVGVDNPVSVSAPMPNFTASAPGLTKTAKGYVMRPTKPGKVTVSVSGKDDNGKTVALGKQEFRVKRIPDPKSYIAGKTGAVKLKKVAFQSASTVQAKMENFDFDIKVAVKSFMFSTTTAGVVNEIKVNGNKLNEKCKSMIKKAKRGQKFYIEQIQVRMPDGSTRELSPINIKLI